MLHSGVQIKKKNEGKKERRKVKRFWPRGNLLCGLLFLSLSLALSKVSHPCWKLLISVKQKLPAHANDGQRFFDRPMFPFDPDSMCLLIHKLESQRRENRGESVNQEYKADIRMLFCFLIERRDGGRITCTCTMSGNTVLPTWQRPRNRGLCWKLALKISTLATSMPPHRYQAARRCVI